MINSAFYSPLVRFAVVGIVSNALLYLAYLALTFQMGLGHLMAMSMVYVAGVLMTFLANRSWTFGHQGTASGAFFRYVLAYVFGYILNFAFLWIAVDVAGLPHALVQAAAIVLVAGCMFALHRFWVFAPVTRVTLVR